MKTFGFKMIFFEVVCLIGLIISDTLTNCINDIIPTKNDVVICDDSCIYCNIICNDNKQCKGIEIYSGAYNTNIYCLTDKSCIDAEIYVGNTGHYPDDYDESHFDSIQNTTNIVCESKRSCDGVSVTMEGFFNYGGLIDLIGDADRIFKDGKLYINIQTNPGYVFDLKCGNYQDNCKNVEYKCYNANCECDGQHENFSGNCQDIQFDNVLTRNPSFSNTSNPTVMTVIPTSIPSTIPTSMPTISTDIPSTFPTETATTTPTISPSNTPSVSPTANLSNVPSLTPTNDLSFNPTLHTIHPSIQPISNILTPNYTKTPTILSNKAIDPKITPLNHSNPLIWIILFGTTLFCCLCCLITIAIIFYINKHKAKQKESDMSVHQPSPQSQVQFNPKEDSIEIIEGIPVTGDGIQADYQIKALQRASVYIDKRATPSTMLSGEDKMHEIIVPTKNVSDINVINDDVDEIELVYSNE